MRSRMGTSMCGQGLLPERKVIAAQYDAHVVASSEMILKTSSKTDISSNLDDLISHVAHAAPYVCMYVCMFECMYVYIHTVS